METWRDKLEKSFGALFSFPPNAIGATAHIKGSNGIPQAYSGMYVTKTVGNFFSAELLLLAEGLERNKMSYLEDYKCGDCGICEACRFYDAEQVKAHNAAIDLAISHLKEVATISTN